LFLSALNPPQPLRPAYIARVFCREIILEISHNTTISMTSLST
jgi:hypothetical protein